jgi:hypothetical protein
MKLSTTLLASTTLAVASAASMGPVNATYMDLVFEPVREVIDNFPLVRDMAFSIGDERGELWRHGYPPPLPPPASIASSI